MLPPTGLSSFETQAQTLARYAAWSRARVQLSLTARREQHLAALPSSISEYLRREWQTLSDVKGYVSANEWIRERALELKRSHIHEAFDTSAIRTIAKRISHRCSKCTNVTAAARVIAAYGIQVPQGREVTPASALKRMRDPRWLRRRLSYAWTMHCEALKRAYGMVHKQRAPYCSRAAVAHRAKQQALSRAWLERCTLVNELGQKLSLLQVHDRSIAHPAIRRAEFMTRVHGFENVAAFHHHAADFWTLTCPSAFHRKLETGGDNPRFEGFSPSEGQRWLSKMWARVRARLQRLKVYIYGVRIAEPHHDATPHWHLLLFGKQQDLAIVREVLSRHWLSDYADEPGADRYRTKVIAVDSHKGSATGYVAKYLSKNIDAHGEIGDAKDYDTDAKISTDLVRAWAAIHHVRQFQQIGGPPVTLWREVRRLRSTVKDTDIERVRKLADAGNFAGFVHALGGIRIGRHTNLNLHREHTGALNYYGEPLPPRIVGVRYASAIQLTRPHSWRIEFNARLQVSAASDLKSDSSLGPVAITVRTASPAGIAPGAPSLWSNPQETSMYGPHRHT